MALVIPNLISQALVILQKIEKWHETADGVPIFLDIFYSFLERQFLSTSGQGG
jgi:hypothetical protein